MKPLMLLLFCFVTSALCAQQDTAYRNRVDSFIYKTEQSSALSKHEVTQKGIRYRYWLYKNRLFKIEKYWSVKTADNNVLENDYRYYADKGKLINAYESEILLVNGNRDDVSVWSATTYFKDDRLLYITSLGHGKTEDDEYDIEKETIKNFQALKTTLLKQLNKKRK